jgi:hypothetical protein
MISAQITVGLARSSRDTAASPPSRPVAAGPTCTQSATAQKGFS